MEAAGRNITQAIVNLMQFLVCKQSAKSEGCHPSTQQILGYASTCHMSGCMLSSSDAAQYFHLSAFFAKSISRHQELWPVHLAM